MPDNSYMGGGSDEVAGASRSLEEVTVRELMEFPPAPARPDWMVTRFPVSMEEYRALEVSARNVDLVQAAAAVGEAAPTLDSGSEAAVEAGEGETVAAGPVPAAPPLTANFAGIPQTAWQPPDCTIGVGPQNVMVAVNTDLAGYSKAGVLQFRWANMTTLFSPVLPGGASIFDPRVAYDHYSNRWIVVTGARRNSPAGSWLMLGVSQTGNPAGAYWVWALDARLNGSAVTNNWADYPMLGFDTQAIYISINMFQFNGGFQYAKLRILNKAEVYGGGVGPSHTIRWYDFWDLRNTDNSGAFTVQPAVHFRGTGGNPSAYLVNSLFPSGSQLTVWTLTNPIAFWSGGAPSLARVFVNCRSYDLPPHALQSGSATRVDTGDIRLLNAVFQNVGGTQRLWTAHTTKFTWQGDSEARSNLQWYEIDVPSKTVVQQNGFGASGAYYFYPAIQTDLSRNAYLVFSRSSASQFAHVRQTGRRVTDAANSLQGSALVAGGASAYTGGRWGDYFGVARDGGDALTVWMYGEHAGAGNTWATRVCSAKF